MNEDHDAAMGSDVLNILVENHPRFQAFLSHGCGLLKTQKKSCKPPS
jgi:hypothetical protein